MKHYQTFLFDWDGTLGNTLGIWVDGWRETFKEFGVELSNEQVISNAFGNWYAPEQMGIEDTASFKSELYARVIEGMATAPLHEGVKEVLSELKNQGKNIAIVTSTKSDVVAPALKHNQIEDYIEFFIGEEKTTKFKPDPEILLKAMEYFDADPATTLIVGDSDKDIHAGKNAKIKAVLSYPEPNKAFYSEETIRSWKADEVIHRFKDLLNLI